MMLAKICHSNILNIRILLKTTNYESGCIIRTFSSKNDDSNFLVSKKTTIKPKKDFKDAKIKNQPDYWSIGHDKKFDRLQKQAKEFQSIKRNDPRSITQILGKPKTYVRSNFPPKNRPYKFDIDGPSKEELAVINERLMKTAKTVAQKQTDFGQSTLRTVIKPLKPKNLSKNKQELAPMPSITAILQRKRDGKAKGRTTNKKNLPIQQKMSEILDEAYVDKYDLPEKRSRQRGIEPPKSIPRRGITNNVIFVRRYLIDFETFRIDRRCKDVFDDIKREEFVGDSIGIFPTNKKFDSKIIKQTVQNSENWTKLIEKDAELRKNPRNAFDVLALLTVQGKLWQYPIDNEQGLEAEAEVPFYEHVLLDHLIEDFPAAGPVREFMELVVMGLSHNPYISVQRKHDTVDYYRTFFQENGLMDSVPECEEKASATA